MNYKDIDIEKLAREVARDETATPPPSAWQKIQGNLSAAAPLAPPKRKASVWMWALLGTFAAAAVILWQAPRDEEEAPMAAVKQPSQPVIAQHATAIEAQPVVQEPAEQKQTPAITKAQTKQAEKKASAEAAVSTPTSTAVDLPADSEPQTAQAEMYENVTADLHHDIEPQVAQHAATPLPAQASETPREETVAPTEETPAAVAPLHDTPLHKEKANLFIPNLLTPNGDGINDYWIIPALQDYEDVQVTIFTAQGNRVYNNNHYKGEFSGSDLEEGSYYYQVVVKSAQIHRRGVLVIRR